jgi:hypothetical protein
VNEVTAHRWLNGSTPINRVVELACEALFRKRDSSEGMQFMRKKIHACG